MKCMGGKFRLRKKIAAFLESVREPGQVYIEPFVGGAWVLQEMSGVRIASDINPALINMYKALQGGWVPPSEISEATYQTVKARMDMGDPLTAFCGFCCSFDAKWFGGYARGNVRNYADNATKSLMRSLPLIQSVQFEFGSYHTKYPEGMLAYCDPPYAGTTEYAFCKGFNHAAFWSCMRKWSRHNIVVVSEYAAPEDFRCVAEFGHRLSVRSTNGAEARLERLFMIR